MPTKVKNDQRSRSHEHKYNRKRRHDKHKRRRDRDEDDFKPIELDVTKNADPANYHKNSKKRASLPKHIKIVIAE